MLTRIGETGSEQSSNMNREQLLHQVHSKTHCQVRDLDIDCCGSRVTVTGTSKTYYVKQLATEAILSTVPWAELDNEITVLAS